MKKKDAKRRTDTIDKMKRDNRKSRGKGNKVRNGKKGAVFGEWDIWADGIMEYGDALLDHQWECVREWEAIKEDGTAFRAHEPCPPMPTIVDMIV